MPVLFIIIIIMIIIYNNTNIEQEILSDILKTFIYVQLKYATVSHVLYRFLLCDDSNLI